MAGLVVEDGTGVPGANSLTTSEFAREYHLIRGNAVWEDLDDDELDVLLIKATDWVQLAFHGMWIGRRVDAAQLLDWPRAYVYIPSLMSWAWYQQQDDDVVPDAVQKAVAIVAEKLRAGGTTFPDQTRLVKRETVGPITTEYEDGSTEATVWPEVWALLRPYLDLRTSMRVVRT
jgi:hypothetical protein